MDLKPWAWAVLVFCALAIVGSRAVDVRIVLMAIAGFALVKGGKSVG
jgi:hypothetical protein